jgi:hypothetical protein
MQTWAQSPEYKKQTNKQTNKNLNMCGSFKFPSRPTYPGQLGAASVFTLLGGLWSIGLLGLDLYETCTAPLRCTGGSALSATGRGRGGRALSSTQGPSQAGISSPRCFMSLHITSST